MKQNVFKKVLPYKMRNAAMALAATVAGMTTTSCEKDDIEPEQPKIRKHNVVLDLSVPGMPAWENCFKTLTNLDSISNIAYAKDVDSVLVVAEKDANWYIVDALVIRALKERCLEPLFNVAPNIYGKGALNFRLGEASRIPEDSTWYVNHGFTINAKTR